MPNNEIVPFAFEGVSIRTLLVDGKPWFVANDITSALGYKNGRDAVAKHTSDSQRRVSRIATPSGEQSATVLSEGGVWRLIMRSNIPNAIAFQDWLADTVVPTIMRTGAYRVEQKSEIDIIRDQHNAISLLLEANEDATTRAVQAESTVDFIEGSEGLSVREFHKQYFSEVPEKQFNEFLYKKHLLLDQRGARGRDERGRIKNGKEHRQPTFRGKAFFFMDPTVDRVTGERHYQTKVRPGRPEVELVAYLADRGLPPNGNTPRILKAVTA